MSYMYTHVYSQHEEPLPLIDVYSSNLQFTFIKLLFRDDELQIRYTVQEGRALGRNVSAHTSLMRFARECAIRAQEVSLDFEESHDSSQESHESSN